MSEAVTADEGVLIRFEGVSKFYGEVLGVNRVNLAIPAGVTSLADVGLSFDGTNGINGTFLKSGQLTLKLTAENAAGKDIAYLVITITRTGGNTSEAKGRNASPAKGRKTTKTKRRIAPAASGVEHRPVSSPSKDLKEAREQLRQVARVTPLCPQCREPFVPHALSAAVAGRAMNSS